MLKPEVHSVSQRRVDAGGGLSQVHRHHAQKW